VEIGAFSGIATSRDARLLLSSPQLNNFVRSSDRSVRFLASTVVPTVTGVAGSGDFRGRVLGHAGRVPWVGLLAIAAACAASGAATARAAPLPYEASVSLGLPPSAVQIRIESSEGDTRIRVRTGRHTAESVVHGRTESVEVERVSLGGGVAAVVRATGEARVAAIVVARRGRPSIAWSGRLDLHGDPGERTASSIEIGDRTGDGAPEIVVGEVREGVGLCGQPPALLYPRALDLGSGDFRPVTLRRVPTEGDEVAITATAESPGPSGPPIVHALRATAATSASGVADAASLGPPSAAADGDSATWWSEGRGGNGDGEMIVLRFGDPSPLRALAITTSAAPGTRAPRSVVIAGPSGPRLRVALPEAPPGTRLYIVPPSPLEWSCFAVVLADAGGEPAARTSIAEVEAYTEVDFGGGVDALVAELVRGSERADRTTEMLSRLGEPAVRALDANWDRLGPRGRERAARVAASVRGENDAALALLARAARDEHAEVRAAALGALASTDAGLVRLVEAAADAGEPAEDAARAVASAERPYPIAPLLAAVSREDGPDRPWLRAAIGAARDAGEVPAWAATAPVAARASVALGLAARLETRGLAEQLVAGAIDEAESFPDRYRLALAARTPALPEGTSATAEAPLSPEVEQRRASIHGWLERVARDAEEWMLRRAAVEALGPEVARRALGDRYPRVRVAAVEVLARSGDDLVRLTTAARSDGWPLVRVAALDAIADRDRETLRAALGDDAQSVRRRAIEHLTRLGDREAWTAIGARLEDRDEWPSVIEAGLGYVETLCVAEAGPALAAVIARGAREGAWEPDVEMAVRALRAAIRLGGRAAADARTVAGRGGEELQAALQRAAEHPETCTPAPR
jgi:hypothetical protein